MSIKLLNRVAAALAAAIFATSGGAAIAAEAAEAADDEVIEEIVVTGIRGSLRKAIDRKRNADSIIDALVAEDIGKFPDQNLAESMQRITGVAIDRMRGEGSMVSIRGLGPEFTRVLLNGRTALSGGSESCAGSCPNAQRTQTRVFRFESMQAELVQAVEVHKSAKANLLEAGLGGTINIRTRRPFDNGGERILAANAVVTDDGLADDNGYRFAAVYSDTWNDELGFLVSVAGDERTLREDWFRIGGYQPRVFNNAVDLNGAPLPTCTLIEGVNTACAYAPRGLAQGTLIEDNQRLNLSAALQWRPNEQWDITVDVSHSDLDRDYEDYHGIWRYNAGLANAASIVQTDQNNMVTYLRTESSQVWSFSRPRTDTVENQTFAVNAQFTPSEKWTLSFDVTHSIGDREQVRPDTYYFQSGVPGVYDARDRYLPSITLETDLLDPTLYDFAIFADALNISGDNETAYRFDATYHLDDGLAINAGISFRDRERDWRRCCEWVVGPRARHFGPIGSEGLGMVDIEYTVLPVDDLHSGISGIESPKTFLMPIADSVRDIYRFGRADEHPPSVAARASRSHDEDFDFWEETLSVYFMMDVAGSIGDIPWSGNVGVRWIEVERASSGNVQPVDRIFLNDTVGIWEFELGPSEFQEHGNRLAELLPSLNLKFDITDDLVGRFSWGKTMTQPSFTQLNPGGEKDNNPMVVEEGDPKLKPYIAEQIDIGLEWYPMDDAIFAVHAFGKEVDGFIINVSELRDWIDPTTGGTVCCEDGSNVTVLFQGPANSDDVFIGGFEVAAQYLFTNLPAPFDGLGLQFNHTWVTTDADLSNTLRTATFTVPGLSENTTNMVLFYEKDRISTRLAWNRREGFLTAVPALHPEYTNDYWQLDAGFSFNITEDISFLVEGINLTDENVDYYNIIGQTSSKKHLSRISNSGRRLQAGIRAQF